MFRLVVLPCFDLCYVGRIVSMYMFAYICICLYVFVCISMCIEYTSTRISIEYAITYICR